MTYRRNTLADAVHAVLAGTGLVALLPGVAMAQDAVPEEIEEIIVTAQLRSQSLQDVPIAMQVVDRALIEDVAAEDMGDLNGFVPGLVVSGDSPTQPRYQIRGIQTGDFGVGTDPAVGVYVDGIYAARSGASMLAFNDIERIEVLKGPQGTLFGRNSAAGAISIVTTQPSHEFDSLLRVRFGEFGKQYYEGMINTPIGEHFALRANGVFNKSDGWMQDAATGADLNPEKNWAGRVALRWDLSDATNVTLSWDHDDLDQLARPAIGVVAVAPGQTQMPYPADSDTYLDPRKAPIYNDVVGNEESRKLDQANLFIDHSFGGAEFRSSTSWRQFDTVNREDEDGTNLISLVLRHGEHREQRKFLPGVQVLGHHRPHRLGRRRELLQREGRPGQRHAHVSPTAIDTLGMNLGLCEAIGLPFPLYGFTSSIIEPTFGVTDARPAVARSHVQPRRLQGLSPRSAT